MISEVDLRALHLGGEMKKGGSLFGVPVRLQDAPLGHAQHRHRLASAGFTTESKI